MKRLMQWRYFLLVPATVLLLIPLVLVTLGNGSDGVRADGGAHQPEPAAIAASPSALEPTYAALIAERRDTGIPPLPFPDNPDPSKCGIPTSWGGDDQAWLTGIYEGDMVQPVVLLYDSHLRLRIAAQAPHGSEVEVILYQQNPVTDYYLVKVVGAEPPNEGWVPAPFLSFNPVTK